MSMRTIGVMGSGGHLVTGHLSFLGNAKVAGIYDPDAASRQTASTALGYTPSSFATPEDLVASRPNAILIGSPDKFHPAQLLLVVKAGIPVLCEKPLAVDAAGLNMVQEALERAHATGLLVASCHQRRTTITDLPYGWVRHNLANLENRFGRLRHIRLNSNYPQPQRQWKHDRSFLADKFVHDIDYLRVLLGNGTFRASREFDSHDHYIVSGSMAYRNSHVKFACEGTRLHNDRDAFLEYVMLNFEHGDCVVYTKTGMVRYHDRQTGSNHQVEITPMVPGSYDLQNQEVTQNFVNGHAVHTASDLLVNTAAVVALAGPAARYQN